MKPIHIFFALIVSFCWGANFVAAKMGMEHFPPIFLLALRFALVASLLLPFYPRCRLPWKFVFQMSCILGTVHFALFFAGIGYGLDIPTAIIAGQMGVPFSCMLSAVYFNDRLGMWRSFGLLIAFMGIVTIAGTPSVVANFMPFMMVIGAALCWAVSNVILKKQGKVNVLELLAWQALLSVPQLLLLSWIIEPSNQFELLMTIPAKAVYAIAFSAICSTIIAYGLWYHLLRECDVSRVAPFNLTIPFFGIAIGQMFYVEPISTQQLIGGLITIFGVGIIVLRRPKLVELGEKS